MGQRRHARVCHSVYPLPQQMRGGSSLNRGGNMGGQIGMGASRRGTFGSSASGPSIVVLGLPRRYTFIICYAGMHQSANRDENHLRFAPMHRQVRERACARISVSDTRHRRDSSILITVSPLCPAITTPTRHTVACVPGDSVRISRHQDVRDGFAHYVVRYRRSADYAARVNALTQLEGKVGECAAGISSGLARADHTRLHPVKMPATWRPFSP